MTEPDVTEVTPKKWHEPFLAALMQHGNVSRAARAAKISRMQLYRERAAAPDFAKAWRDAQQIGLDSLEDVANTRARKDSDTLLIFLLKAHRPEKYRETTRHELSGPAGKPIQIETFDYDTAIAKITTRSDEDSEASSADTGT